MFFKKNNQKKTITKVNPLINVALLPTPSPMELWKIRA